MCVQSLEQVLPAEPCKEFFGTVEGDGAVFGLLNTHDEECKSCEECIEPDFERVWWTVHRNDGTILHKIKCGDDSPPWSCVSQDDALLYFPKDKCIVLAEIKTGDCIPLAFDTPSHVKHGAAFGDMLALLCKDVVCLFDRGEIFHTYQVPACLSVALTATQLVLGFKDRVDFFHHNGKMVKSLEGVNGSHLAVNGNFLAIYDSVKAEIAIYGFHSGEFVHKVKPEHDVPGLKVWGNSFAYVKPDGFIQVFTNTPTLPSHSPHSHSPPFRSQIVNFM